MLIGLRIIEETLSLMMCRLNHNDQTKITKTQKFKKEDNKSKKNWSLSILLEKLDKKISQLIKMEEKDRNILSQT